MDKVARSRSGPCQSGGQQKKLGLKLGVHNRRRARLIWLWVVFYGVAVCSLSRSETPLLAGNTESEPRDALERLPPLDWTGDLSARMIDGIHRFIDRYAAEVIAGRAGRWSRDLTSVDTYRRSVAPQRKELARILGLVDKRLEPEMEFFGTLENPARVAESETLVVDQVRWSVLEEVWGEGLLITPRGRIRGRAVVLPDADQVPEQMADLSGTTGTPLGRLLAENGVQVVIPTLISRDSQFSGNPGIDRWTNQPHREWIYRQAFQSGRHIIGYELQKIISVIDWFSSHEGVALPLSVAGYGEGGLLAFYAGAIDERIDSVLVSGYFGPRERLWEEPVYRNVWALQKTFGDAEIATLIFPRSLIVDYSQVPPVDGPPPATNSQRNIAAPGKLWTPSLQEVRSEFQRALDLLDGAEIEPKFRFVHSSGDPEPNPSRVAAFELLESMQIETRNQARTPLVDVRRSPDFERRQLRQIKQLSEHAQRQVLFADRIRDAFFQGDRSSPEQWKESTRKFRDYYWDEIVGRLPQPSLSPSPRARKVYDEPGWVGYEVILDVWPDVYAWGILALPRDLRPGEQRPVVVCQHGHDGLPEELVAQEGRAFEIYGALAARLAGEGFITFSPHNPTRGGNHFRTIERKANPVQASLFSVITGQHQQILRWLSSLPFVDSSRIAFYGLSWGGRTAIRVPALLEDYCLSITSGDFNHWNRKLITVDYTNSYMYSEAFETYEFNLANTFDHSELAGLIAPRPFMVESGYYDAVAWIEWVGYEYAQVKRLYDELGISDRTRLEFFPGPHRINGVGTFDFLRKHLKWKAKN